MDGRIDCRLRVAALVVVVAVGVHRLRSATEGGQCVNCGGDVFYLIPRQFASTDALQNSIVVIHSGTPFCSEATIAPYGFLPTSSVIPLHSSKRGHGSRRVILPLKRAVLAISATMPDLGKVTVLIVAWKM
jgi:hypothetical protein